MLSVWRSTIGDVRNKPRQTRQKWGGRGYSNNYFLVSLHSYVQLLLKTKRVFPRKYIFLKCNLNVETTSTLKGPRFQRILPLYVRTFPLLLRLCLQFEFSSKTMKWQQVESVVCPSIFPPSWLYISVDLIESRNYGRGFDHGSCRYRNWSDRFYDCSKDVLHSCCWRSERRELSLILCFS